LAEGLEKFPTIKDPDHEIAFQLFAKGYQLLEPSIKERNAMYESLTYSNLWQTMVATESVRE
jgi:DNA-directed RNA polymerase subunit beta